MWDLEAEMIRKRLPVGRTRPIALAARGPASDDPLVDVVIKPATRLQRPPLEYLLEWVGAHVADAIGLNVPRCHRVRITRDLAHAAREVEMIQDLLGSVGLVFGAEWMAPTTPVVAPDELTPERRIRAATILAFDIFTLNVDRRQGNPNVLDMGEEFLCLDHELSFSFLLPNIGGPSPATDPGLGIVDRHIFRRAFTSRRSPDFGPFRAALADLTDDRLDQIAQSVPKEWTTGKAQGKIEEIMDVLAQRRDAVEQWLPQVDARLCS